MCVGGGGGGRALLDDITLLTVHALTLTSFINSGWYQNNNIIGAY